MISNKTAKLFAHYIIFLGDCENQLEVSR